MFTKINAQERNALIGLPHLQIVLYVIALKSRMDFSSGIIGEKFRVSWQSLARDLCVDPVFGRKPQAITKPMVRSAATQLEKRGLIKIISENKCLIIKCLLTDLIDLSEIDKGMYEVQHTCSDNLTAEKHQDYIDKSISLEDSAESKNIEELPRCSTYQYNNISKEKDISTNVDIYKKKSSRGSQLSLSFTVTDHHREMAEKNDWPSPDREIEGFKDYHLARGTTFKDWDRAFYTWLRNAKRFRQTNSGGYSQVSRREQAMLNTIATCIPDYGNVYEQ